MKHIKIPYKLLIYDIETGLLLAWLFSLGEQSVRHNQLNSMFYNYNIISIAYKWYGDKEIHVLSGDNAVKEFDKVIKQADVTIGKNSDRFDVKRINSQRMLQGLKPMPEWADTSEDLEKQLRKYFAFPSQSLDYVSKLLGFGGKIKMEFQDWVDIANYQLLHKLDRISSYTSFVLFGRCTSEIEKIGVKALKKMLYYNKKDVSDTEKVLMRVLPYIRLKKNAATINEKRGCITCGSSDIVPTKIVTIGTTKYQTWECCGKSHSGYAGKCTYGWNGGHKAFGRMK